MRSNAIAGRRFAGFAAFEAQLEAWTGEVADTRAHGTTGEPPRLRFERDEAHRLRPAAGVLPFNASRDLVLKATADCSVESEEDQRALQWESRPTNGNACSVAWRLIGERVTVTVAGAELRALHAGREMARHPARAPL